MLDIKIINGTVFNGVSEEGFRADIGILGEKIVEIGNLVDAPAREIIDAQGKAVCPGFVDVHTHSDMSLIYDHMGSSKVYDGVTTDVIGNCGIGVAPVCEERKKELITYLGTRLIGTIPVRLELPWNTMEEYLDTMDQHHPAINVVPLVSHGAIRINEMGFAKENPTERQLARMREQVRIAMEAGCAGLSSGLMYMPGEYSTVEELGELSRAVAPFDSFYVSHIRNEGDTIFEALDEAIAVAKWGGTALHISHLKLAGSGVWGKTDQVFEKIDKARREGVEVTFDVYPYACGCTSLGTCMPPWTFEGGTSNMLERIKDSGNRSRIIQEIRDGLPKWQNPVKTVGDWNRITFASADTEEGKAALIGKTIAQVCGEMGCDPYELIFDTLIRENGRVQILPAMMDQDDVDKIVSHPDSMIGSDGMSLSTEGILSTGNPHPRAFGTHGHVLAYYVRERKLLSLGAAIRKMTSMPAHRLRLQERGELKMGYFADITVFDPETVQDMATYVKPKQYTRGIHTVIVNGRIALRDGVQTGEAAGRTLRKQRK
ncbi:MAG: D-aminoacylase [Enterocloster asparagiformis]|nr:D-aminoacylase [Enterocloster asparagiformis]